MAPSGAAGRGFCVGIKFTTKVVRGLSHSEAQLGKGYYRTLKSMDECCRADTPLASSSDVSRSRPTTDPHGCFVTARPMILAEAISPALGPGAFPYTLHAPGPAATSTYSPVP